MIHRFISKSIKNSVLKSSISLVNYYPKIFISSLTNKLSNQFSTLLVQKQIKQQSKVLRYHGRTIIDQNYSYEVNNQKVEQFCEDQLQNYLNIYKNNPALQQRVSEYYERVTSRRDPRSTSIPQRYDDYQYYLKNAYYQDSSYSTIHRKNIKLNKEQQSLKSQNQDVLDIMNYKQFKNHHKTATLQSINFSKSHSMIAFGVDILNNQNIKWNIKKINPNQNNKNISAFKSSTSFQLLFKWNENYGINNVQFHGDQGIFYLKTHNRKPKTLCYKRVYKNKMQVDDDQIIIYEQKDNFHLNIQKSKDHKFIIITCSSHSKTKVLALNINSFQKFLQNKQKKLQNKFHSRFLITLKQQSNEKYFISHSGNNFIFIKSSQQGQTISLLNSSSLEQQRSIKNLSSIKSLQQKIIYQTLPDQKIDSIDTFQNKLVLYIKKVTKPILRLIDLRTKKAKDISLPYQIGIIKPAANKFYETDQFGFTINTPFLYQQSYKYIISQNKVQLWQQFKLVGGKQFKMKNYEVKTFNVPSETGDFIPLTLITKKLGTIQSLKGRQRRKCLLHVYGHYGIDNQVNFVNHYLTALQNDWIIAYAHVRGGGQKGQKWHKQVKQDGNRCRSWKDLTQCVGYLIKQNYTHPSILFLHCHSAGSITAWNAINMYPHLYKGVVMLYPFLDVIGSLMKKDDPLSDSDHQQFGNPIINQEAFYDIQSYSPYQTIQSKKQYPLIYLIAGQNDYRCPIWQIAKFVKRFRKRTQSSQNTKLNDQFKNTLPQGKNIIVRVDGQSSHFGSANLQSQTLRNCQMMGFLEYVCQEKSKDCLYE